MVTGGCQGGWININGHAPLSTRTLLKSHQALSVCVDGVITHGLATHSCLRAHRGEAAISSQHEVQSEATLPSTPSVNK